MVLWLSSNSNRPRYDAALEVFYANTFVNCLFTSLTLCLIWYMWKKQVLKMHIYAKCVLMMTLLQFIYETCTPFVVVACSPTSENWTCTAVIAFGIVFGGVGATAWSFIIVLFALLTVEYQRRPSEKEKFWTILLVNGALLAFAIPYLFIGYRAHADLKVWGTWLHVYDNVRLTLIALTGVAIGRLYILCRRVTIVGQRQSSPLWQLLRRLILYPIVQGLARLGGSSYTFAYGQLINQYPANEDQASPLQTFLLYCVVVLMPLAGIGGFLVFLLMQSGAKHHLVQMLHLECLCQVPPEPTTFKRTSSVGGGGRPSMSAGDADGRLSTASFKSSDGKGKDTDAAKSLPRNPEIIHQVKASRAQTHTGTDADGAGTEGSESELELEREGERLFSMDEADLADQVVMQVQVYTQKQDVYVDNNVVVQKSRTMTDMASAGKSDVEGGGGGGGEGEEEEEEEEREGSIVGIEFNPIFSKEKQ